MDYLLRLAARPGALSSTVFAFLNIIRLFSELVLKYFLENPNVSLVIGEVFCSYSLVLGRARGFAERQKVI